MLVSLSSSSARRPGRRWFDPESEERSKHIRAAALLLSGKYPPLKVAELHGVCLRTLYNWKEAALSYDDPEAEGLRRLAGKGRCQ